MGLIDLIPIAGGGRVEYLPLPGVFFSSIDRTCIEALRTELIEMIKGIQEEELLVLMKESLIQLQLGAENGQIAILFFIQNQFTEERSLPRK